MHDPRMLGCQQLRNDVFGKRTNELRALPTTLKGGRPGQLLSPLKKSSAMGKGALRRPNLQLKTSDTFAILSQLEEAHT